jgi:hypothetical protein
MRKALKSSSFCKSVVMTSIPFISKSSSVPRFFEGFAGGGIAKKVGGSSGHEHRLEVFLQNLSAPSCIRPILPNIGCSARAEYSVAQRHGLAVKEPTSALLPPNPQRYQGKGQVVYRPTLASCLRDGLHLWRLSTGQARI